MRELKKSSSSWVSRRPRAGAPAGVLVMDRPNPVVSLRATTGYKL
ncbi:MAG TPA: hypothetical protein VMN36_16925 [Verrucomicrobiales bacterium]|nr:hypothetical protein [Verrucomicrobiales bacterium]